MKNGSDLMEPTMKRRINLDQLVLIIYNINWSKLGIPGPRTMLLDQTNQC